MRSSRPTGLTAREFFERKLPSFTITAAQIATKHAYSALHDCVSGKTRSPRKDLLIALQEWSIAAIAEHGVYISAAKTLGLPEEPAFRAA